MQTSRRLIAPQLTNNGSNGLAGWCSNQLSLRPGIFCNIRHPCVSEEENFCSLPRRFLYTQIFTCNSATPKPSVSCNAIACRQINTSSCLYRAKAFIPHTTAQRPAAENFRMPRGVGYYTDSGVPVITVPYQLAHKVERRKFRTKALEAIRHREGDNYNRMSKAKIIECKRRNYNHYSGQTYRESGDDLKLVTQGWGSARRNGDWFVVKPLRSESSSLHNVERSFEELDGIHPSLIAFLLERKRFKQPTNVQEAAMPVIRRGENALVVAETGSGKTYSYLVPLISAMLKERQMLPDEWQNPPTNAPRLLILIPQRDLLYQVQRVVQELISSLPNQEQDNKFTVHAECGGEGTEVKLRYPKFGVTDILLATPGMLNILLGNRLVSLERCRTVVLDECDTLLDDSFNPLVTRILHRMTIRSRADLALAGEPEYAAGTQLVLVGATLPRSLSTILETICNADDEITKIMSPNIHRPLQNVRQEFYRTAHGDKTDRLYNMVRQNVEEKKCCMIFCVKTRTAFYLQKFFTENGMDVPCLTGEMHPEKRRHVWERFRNGDSNALICTDIASRGMDTHFVRHVINFEFPFFMSDYIHRCGRVGRVNSEAIGKHTGQGRVTSFVTRRGEASAVQRIEQAVRKNMPFTNVNANIARKLNAQNFGIDAESSVGADEGKQEANDQGMLLPSRMEHNERRLEERIDRMQRN